MLADLFCWSALAIDGGTAQAVITVSTVLYVEWGRLGEIGDLLQMAWAATPFARVSSSSTDHWS